MENSEPFKDLEAVSREGFKTILLAEQLLREAEAKDADCLSAVEFLLFRNACCVLVDRYSTVVYRGLDYQKASTHLFLFVAFSSSTCDLFVDFSSSTAFLDDDTPLIFDDLRCSSNLHTHQHHQKLAKLYAFTILYLLFGLFGC